MIDWFKQLDRKHQGFIANADFESHINSEFPSHGLNREQMDELIDRRDSESDHQMHYKVGHVHCTFTPLCGAAVALFSRIGLGVTLQYESHARPGEDSVKTVHAQAAKGGSG